MSDEVASCEIACNASWRTGSNDGCTVPQTTQHCAQIPYLAPHYFPIHQQLSWPNVEIAMAAGTLGFGPAVSAWSVDLPFGQTVHGIGKKKCRPGNKRRKKKYQWQQQQNGTQRCQQQRAAQDYDSEEMTCPTLYGDSEQTVVQQTNEAASSYEPREPILLEEYGNGNNLRIVTYNGEKHINRGRMLAKYLQENSLHSSVRLWLQGNPLCTIVQFQRGRAGQTPTISQGGLAEIQDGGGNLLLEVKYLEYGNYVYRRSCANEMPSECTSDGCTKPLYWLGKQRTYGSPGLDAPLPNRVAEWLEGRDLTPAVSAPSVSVSS